MSQAKKSRFKRVGRFSLNLDENIKKHMSLSEIDSMPKVSRLGHMNIKSEINLPLIKNNSSGISQKSIKSIASKKSRFNGSDNG
jgi:hypothetical protein